MGDDVSSFLYPTDAGGSADRRVHGLRLRAREKARGWWGVEAVLIKCFVIRNTHPCE